MRRLATILGGLAFLWACAATGYLLTASSGTGVASSVILASDATNAPPLLPAMGTATGVWVTGLLFFLTLLTSVPVGVGLAHPVDQRPTAWTAGLALLGFSLLAGPSLGLPYLPTAVLLLAAAAVGEVESAPRHLDASRL